VVTVGWCDGLNDNDGYDESVNTEHTSHDNGDNIFDNPSGMVNSHVTHTETRPPGAPGTAPGSQNHTTRRTQVSTGATTKCVSGAETKEIKDTRQQQHSVVKKRKRKRFSWRVPCPYLFVLLPRVQSSLSTTRPHAHCRRESSLAPQRGVTSGKSLLLHETKWTYKAGAQDGHPSNPATTSVMVGKLKRDGRNCANHQWTCK